MLIFLSIVHVTTRPSCEIVEGFNKVPARLVFRDNADHPDLFPGYQNHEANSILWKVEEKTYGEKVYNRKLPLIFVGGHPRSGTGLKN